MIPFAIEILGSRNVQIGFRNIVIDAECQISILILQSHPLSGSTGRSILCVAAFMEQIPVDTGTAVGTEPQLNTEILSSQLQVIIRGLFHSAVGRSCRQLQCLLANTAYPCRSEINRFGPSIYRIDSRCTGSLIKREISQLVQYHRSFHLNRSGKGCHGKPADTLYSICISTCCSRSSLNCKETLFLIHRNGKPFRQPGNFYIFGILPRI